jgi:hypothetical protein
MEGTYSFVSLKEDNPTALITRGQVVARVVKLNCGDDVG